MLDVEFESKSEPTTVYTKSDLYKAANYATELEQMIQDGEELDGWVQAKITKAADYLSSVKHYLEYEKIKG